jgi:hypothetical protein
MESKYWDGKTVHLAHTNPEHDRRSLELALTDQTARDLALALSRLKQTTFALQDGVQEVLDALNYVLVADPVSVAAHKRMEAGKSMDPAAGDPRSYEPYFVDVRGLRRADDGEIL